MKKVGKVLLGAAVLSSLVISSGASVSAMSKDELKTKFTQDYTIAGQTTSLEDNVKVLVEEYLANNDISSEDADYIAGKIDEAVAILNEAGTTSWDSLSDTYKNEIKQLVIDVSNNTAVKVDIVSHGVVVYNLDGTVFTTITEDVIKQTSEENAGMPVAGIIAGILVVAGACVAAYAVKKNAKA